MRRLGDFLTLAVIVTACAALLYFSLGCASSKSIPTSSDANVSADVVTAKGGTIGCAAGAVIKLDATTGNVVELVCPQNLAWTDPPTAEETTALSEFGQAFLDVLGIPFRILAAVGGAVASK